MRDVSSFVNKSDGYTGRYLLSRLLTLAERRGQELDKILIRLNEIIHNGWEIFARVRLPQDRYKILLIQLDVISSIPYLMKYELSFVYCILIERKQRAA